MTTLGKRIAQAREMVGLNQSELAKAIGVTKASVSQWEAEQTKNLRINNLFEVARITGADIYWLAVGAPPPPHTKAMVQFAKLPPEFQRMVIDQITTLTDFAARKTA